VTGSGGVAASPLGAGACGDDDWDGESLTVEELARLAAWDRAAGLAGEPAEDEEWLAGLSPEQWDESAADGPAAGPEALPGLMPRRWASGGGFDAGVGVDAIPPGPVLAGLAAGKQEEGLAGASDDELAGLMVAWRRIGSWAAAGELAAVAELDRRRAAQVAAGADAHLAEHVADEVAMVLTLDLPRRGQAHRFRGQASQAAQDGGGAARRRHRCAQGAGGHRRAGRAGRAARRPGGGVCARPGPRADDR
jgi:hypothetical protein